MIESAEEFSRLRRSEVADDYQRAASDSATDAVWLDTVEKFPDLAFWVAQNKTVSVNVLRQLASHADPNVRWMVARKRKLPVDMLLQFMSDDAEEVRTAVAYHHRTSNAMLVELTNDASFVVREAARERLGG